MFLWECDNDKWAITGAIFARHNCGDKRPAISPADARDAATVRHQRPRLSTAAPRPAPPSHPSLVPLDCRGRVANSSSAKRWPHSGHAEQDDQISLGNEGEENPAVAFVDTLTKQQKSLFLEFCVQRDVFIKKERLSWEEAAAESPPETCWYPPNFLVGQNISKNLCNCDLQVTISLKGSSRNVRLRLSHKTKFL